MTSAHCGVKCWLCACCFTTRPWGAHLVITPICRPQRHRSPVSEGLPELYRTAQEHQGRVTRRVASQVLALGPIRAGAGWPLLSRWHLMTPDLPSGGLCQPMLSSD